MSYNNEPSNSSWENTREEHKEATEHAKPVEYTIGSLLSGNLTMNKLIEKFIPIVGAIFLTVGIGYLIYTNAWVNLPIEGRLGLGFFLSLAVIGGSFSFSEKLNNFANIGIGSGILLLYGTLIYGSRTTDVAAALIPEIATLVTAFLFIIAVSFFASQRNSRTIILLGMIGAYITPFVIGQDDVWAQNISFNAYLIYFTAINASVFLLAREVSIRDIIPLNIIGLFVGTSTLYHLSYYNGISQIAKQNFFTGELCTAIVFAILVIFLTWSVLVSAHRFKESDDRYLALGYMAPILWFIYNINRLDSLANLAEGSLYAAIAASCFYGWHFLRRVGDRFQHVALYASGLLSSILAFFAFFPNLDVYSSIAIAYLSLIFALIYIYDPSKTERFVSYGVISFMGSYLSLLHILDIPDLSYRSLYIIVALIPAMSAYFIAKAGGKPEFNLFSKLYSLLAFVITIMLVLEDLIEYIDLGFLLFYVGPLIALVYMILFYKSSGSENQHAVKSN